MEAPVRLCFRLLLGDTHFHLFLSPLAVSVSSFMSHSRLVSLPIALFQVQVLSKVSFVLRANPSLEVG